ncbi:MAG: SMP-30/gluconolactonase/LRE family protein [Alphaproteobacteria bacterium]|nr:SMP-30/gluconolactonase/LRE family protein [Alphaproteobacteria bacterium]
MSEPEVECIVECANILGEGPIWHPKEQALYWCDNLKPSIQRYDPATGAVTAWPLEKQVGSIVFREQGGVAAGMEHGFCFIYLDSGTIEEIVDPEADLSGNRLNDGKCDRAGRYWCGSMDAALKSPTAALYRFDPDKSCHRMDDGFTVSNGIAFSPDDKVMYFSDSRADTVYAYDFDLASGMIANRRVFISTKDIAGRVDGATVDADGFYWCAHIHAGEIARYDPDGALERTIPLPVRHPTMCTFGGENLDTLYVTSSTKFLEPGKAEKQPLAGGLFAVRDVGATGLVEPFFAG